MTDRQTQVKLLGEALAELSSFVPSSRLELEEWYRQADLLRMEYLRPGDDCLPVPHFIWHYLSDADIRMKDEGYAEIQNGRLRSFIDDLKQGVLPDDDEAIIDPIGGALDLVRGLLRGRK